MKYLDYLEIEDSMPKKLFLLKICRQISSIIQSFETFGFFFGLWPKLFCAFGFGFGRFEYIFSMIEIIKHMQKKFEKILEENTNIIDLEHSSRVAIN